MIDGTLDGNSVGYVELYMSGRDGSSVGCLVALADGNQVGCGVVGFAVGRGVSLKDGDLDGFSVGARDGVGYLVGLSDGPFVGAKVVAQQRSRGKLGFQQLSPVMEKIGRAHV